MTRQKLERLYTVLDEYYQEKSKTCEFDCYNCELGILEGNGHGHSCAIETITRNIDYELYP